MATKLSLKGLNYVRNGALGMLVDDELNKLLQDLRDRPMLVKPRELTLKIKLTPPTASEQFEDCDAEFSVRTSVPERSIATRMLDGVDGLEFSPGAPDNARQRTMEMANEDE